MVRPPAAPGARSYARAPASFDERPHRQDPRVASKNTALSVTEQPTSTTHESSPLLGRHPMLLLLAVCTLLAILSLLLPSTPTYDPWAWIIWGREIADGHLNTRTGPSWKPLPVVFTTAFAPAGDAAPALWLVVARAAALLAVALAYRLAWRLAGRGRIGAAAGALAAIALVLSGDWLRNAALGNSEGMLVALVLWAAERHLDGRRGQALVLGFLAGLLRPEIWPFLGLYGLFLWVRERRRRPLLAGLAVLLPMLWLLPELWGSGDLLRASERAQDPNPDSPAFADNPTLEVLTRAGGMVLWPLQAAALVGVALSFASPVDRRLDRVVQALTFVAVGWVALVAAMTEAGYSGNARYLVLYAGLTSVLGAVGFARLARWLATRLPQLPGRLQPAPAVLAALVALTVPLALAPVGELPDEARAIAAEAGSNRDLELAVRDAGGPQEVLSCGPAAIGPFDVPALAWQLRVHQEQVDVEPALPGVVFRDRPGRYRRPASEPGPRAPYRRIARAGSWRVLAACNSRRDQRVNVPRAGRAGPADR